MFIGCIKGACAIKKIITVTAIFAAVVLLIGAFGGRKAEETQAMSVYAGKNGVDTRAEAAVLLEVESKSLLYAQSAEKRLPMASTTKIMTAILVLEQGDIDETVTVTAESVGVEGSSMYLKAGERFTKKELLYGLMLQSGNDAAMALAIATDGSAQAFTERMNRKAQALGLAATHFENPHGLSAEGHYTTAKELALLMAYALKVKGFAEISGTKSIVLEGDGHSARHLFNHNKLLKVYEGMIAGKTGYTMASGRCLVTAARRGDMTLVSVTLNDRNDWEDHTALLNYGFSAFKMVKACSKGEKAAIPVSGGKEAAVLAETREDVWLCLPTGTEFNRVFDNSTVAAPVKGGAAVATIRFFENGTLVAEAPLYALFSVRRK